MQTHELPPDENNGHTILGLVWSSTGLAVVAVAFRFYDRTFLRSGVGWDDWTILCAIIIAVFGAACNTIMVQNNFGRHIEYMSEENISESLKYVVYAVIQTYIAIYLVKLSVCFFVLRIMSKTHDYIRWVVYVLMAIPTVVTVVGVTLTCVQCTPIEGSRNLDPHFHKKCLPAHVQVSVARAFGVRRLQMNLRKKVTVIAMMGLVFVATACAVVKTVTTTFGSRDASWDDMVPLIFSALEESLGVIAASMPALRHTFRRFLHSPGSLKNTARTYETSYPTYRYDQSTFKSSVSRGYDGFSEMDTGEDILLVAPAAPAGVLQTVTFGVKSQRASDIVDD
ncbi:hypothetical protein BU23DRAFT_597523 [Bimuria novae-zelandiae CBS 107.79]|uniref:Rhodopsin domain-containing protein n=1 Tax=Bimuria novae-zelandiae CBS 107.79 TaxID=1447943 RepID=A0A6A5VF59_9PLEO|nr:hypothetical protein BU23DRAFT_597523 [Bimuria novae-zelandiae CBS 107.79]